MPSPAGEPEMREPEASEGLGRGERSAGADFDAGADVLDSAVAVPPAEDLDELRESDAIEIYAAVKCPAKRGPPHTSAIVR